MNDDFTRGFFNTLGILRGFTESDEELNKLQATAEAVEGVREVRCEASTGLVDIDMS